MNTKEGKYSNPFSATFNGIMELFKKHESIGELNEQDRLDGKKVLITGASSGLGFATSVELAKRGAQVIMACRSGIPEKGEEVKKLSGSDQVDMLHVDLSDLDSIYRLVDEFKTKFRSCDILICNAAVVPGKSRKTIQGLEEMFVVNYLSKFVLINSLIEKNAIQSKFNDYPRVIIVSSESHRNPKDYKWEEFGVYKDYSMGKTVELYGYYKLLLTTLFKELKRRFGGEIYFYSLCPGPVNSNIAREAPKLFQPLMKFIFKMFFRSPEVASEPVVYLATSPDLKAKKVEYLYLMTQKEIDEKAASSKNGQLLWEKSENLLKEIGVSAG